MSDMLGSAWIALVKQVPLVQALVKPTRPGPRPAVHKVVRVASGECHDGVCPCRCPMHPGPSTEDHAVMARRQQGPSNSEIGRVASRTPDIPLRNVLELQLGAKD